MRHRSDDQAADGLTTCLECGVQWCGERAYGRCATCEAAWEAYRRAWEAPDDPT
jgi:hypothetical protein